MICYLVSKNSEKEIGNKTLLHSEETLLKILTEFGSELLLFSIGKSGSGKLTNIKIHDTKHTLLNTNFPVYLRLNSLLLYIM